MIGFGRPRQCKREGLGLQILGNFIKPQLSHHLLNPTYVLVVVFSYGSMDSTRSSWVELEVANVRPITNSQLGDYSYTYNTYQQNVRQCVARSWTQYNLANLAWQTCRLSRQWTCSKELNNVFIICQQTWQRTRWLSILYFFP